MSNQEKNGERMTFRISTTLKEMIEKAVSVGGYVNPSDFVRNAIREKLMFMGIVEGQRHCVGCGKLLTREDMMQSQGWHCAECFKKALEE